MRIIMTALLLAGMASAQEGEQTKYGWQKEASVALNITQASFDNYRQGGENSTAWQVRSLLKFVNDREKFTWANSGKFEYGSVKSGSGPVKKAADEIKVESVLTYKVGKLLNPYLSGVGETQFAPGYDYSRAPKEKISRFMDPAVFREGLGLGYKPSDVVQVRFGAAAKQTLSRTFTFYSDDPSTTKVEKVKNEVGAESVVDFNYKLASTAQIKSKLELFSDCKSADRIDVIWDSDLTAKVTRLIAFSFNVKLVYDKDLSAKRQLKQVMGIGLSYSLF